MQHRALKLLLTSFALLTKLALLTNMKISFCLSYSSIMFPHNILLLFAMQLLIFVESDVSRRWFYLARFPLRVVGSNGLGPSTSRLSGVCSNQLSYEPTCGGGNRVRTDDPLLAGQVLYQLSYTPIIRALSQNKCPYLYSRSMSIKNE